MEQPFKKRSSKKKSSKKKSSKKKSSKKTKRSKKVSKKDIHHQEAVKLLIEKYGEEEGKVIKAALYNYIKSNFPDMSSLERAKTMLDHVVDEKWIDLGLDLKSTAKIVKEKNKERETRLKKLEKEHAINDKEKTALNKKPASKEKKEVKTKAIKKTTTKAKKSKSK